MPLMMGIHEKLLLSFRTGAVDSSASQTPEVWSLVNVSHSDCKSKYDVMCATNSANA